MACKMAQDFFLHRTKYTSHTKLCQVFILSHQLFILNKNLFSDEFNAGILADVLQSARLLEQEMCFDADRKLPYISFYRGK